MSNDGGYEPREARATVAVPLKTSFFTRSRKTNRKNKSDDIVKSKSSESRLKIIEDEDTADWNIDTFLEQKWERKRTHHSPDEVLRKPRRKSNWKCNLKDMHDKQANLEYTMKKLGLTDK